MVTTVSLPRKTRVTMTSALHICLLICVTVCWIYPAVVTAVDGEQQQEQDVTEEATAKAAARFACAGRPAGYYADLESGCQKYHMCDAGGRIYTYSCPNRTLFQQRVMICDHWFMVDCSLSANYFSSNSLIGQKDKHFVTDNEEFYRRSQEESSLHRRKTPHQRVTPTPESNKTSYQTTPYPWKSYKVTPTTADATSTRRTSYQTSGASPYPLRPTPINANVVTTPVTLENESEVKQYLQFGERKQEEKLPTLKFPQSPKKAAIQYSIPAKKEDLVLPKAYANNPFFKSLTSTAGPTEATPVYTTVKGQYVTRSLSSSTRQQQQNFFGSTQQQSSTKNYAYSTGSVTSRPTLGTTTSAPALVNRLTTTISSSKNTASWSRGVELSNNTFTKSYRDWTPTAVTTTSAGHTPTPSGVTPQGQRNHLENNDLLQPPWRNTFSRFGSVVADGRSSVTESPLTTQYELFDSKRNLPTAPSFALLGENPTASSTVGEDPAAPSTALEDLTATSAPLFGEDPLLLEQAEDLSSNTVELRFADTRHMFYIPDSPSRHAEMLRANNETVLTISLSPPSNRHSHAAMRFKGARGGKGSNDLCPQCHPAFLLPGKCQPCVLIR